MIKPGLDEVRWTPGEHLQDQGMKRGHFSAWRDSFAPSLLFKDPKGKSRVIGRLMKKLRLNGK